MALTSRFVAVAAVSAAVLAGAVVWTTSAQSAALLPQAVNDSYTTPENVTLNVDAPGVLTNDLNVDSGAGDIAIVKSTTTDGVLTPNGDGSFSYVPNNGFTGIDTFIYCIGTVAPTCLSNLATVTITVGAPPTTTVTDTVTNTVTTPAIPATVTNTATVTDTATVTNTVTDTVTDTTPAIPATVTNTVTNTVTAIPATATVTNTATVTEPVTVTNTVTEPVTVTNTVTNTVTDPVTVTNTTTVADPVTVTVTAGGSSGASGGTSGSTGTSGAGGSSTGTGGAGGAASSSASSGSGTLAATGVDSTKMLRLVVLLLVSGLVLLGAGLGWRRSTRRAH